MQESNALVNFLIVGAQKSGTTTLHSYLGDHSLIEMASKKEVHFFDRDEFFLNPEPNYVNYHSWFDFSDVSKLKGEATPAYLYNRNAAERIWRYNPSMKIIIILRNPVERAFSHWNMEVNRGLEMLIFKDALTQEHKRIREVLPSQHYIYSYQDRGYYSAQIREYWRFFGSKQTLVLKYDDLRDNPELVLRKVFGFLSLDYSVDSMASKSYSRVLHKGDYRVSMDKGLRKQLIKQFTPEILQLEKMLGWDCKKWFLECK